MERRNIFAGIGIVCLIIAILFAVFLAQKRDAIPEEALLKIKEAEISLEKNGIKNIAGVNPKYEKVGLEYYYEYDYCLGIANLIVNKFGGFVDLKGAKKLSIISNDLTAELNAQENNIKLPLAIVNGNADLYDNADNYIKSEGSFGTFISGVSACSETILTQELCGVLKKKPELCDKAPLKKENIQAEKSIPNDFLCYDSCNINYLSGDKIFSQNWHGPPCNRIADYVEGESRITGRECYKNSCKSDSNDLSCCKSNECADSGKCHPISAKKDIGNDGQVELCTNIGNKNAWVNPDLSFEACSAAGFKWLENYGKNSKGLCCGDDKKEHAEQCKGNICTKSNDFACCGPDSCVFNGKCRQNGCNQIELSSGEKINAFCDGSANTWADLDNSYCVQCLGKKAWAGSICCGDDAGEGKYPVKFAVNKNITNNILYYGCVNKESDCVHPESEASFDERVYVFKDDKYLKGGYYCKNSQWHSLDTSKKYCKEGGFNWDENKQICCGDNANEFYVKGSDETSACCSSPADIAADGECNPTTLCGNNVINSGEQCEPPNTENSTNCNQQESQCLGNKLGIRSSKGFCNDNCQCQSEEFAYSCMKDNCGAECGSNSDCGELNKCDLNSCSCKPKMYCGDGIVQSYNDFAQKEDCEPPNTNNNAYCKIEECKDKKSVSISTGAIYNNGNCKNDCQCEYLNEEYSCKKDVCGAKCSQDGSGCDENSLCNTQTCGCEPRPVICGNEICEEGEQASCPDDCKKSECPYRIGLKLDKNSYYLNDTINLEVTAYNANNDPIPEAKFDLDIVVNYVLVGSSAYSTSPTGTHTIKKKVNNFAPRGFHKYIAKSKSRGCSIVTDSKSAYVYVNNQYTIPPAKINYSRFDFIIGVFNVTNEKISPKCGNYIIEPGEACEGSSICRASLGCDYQNKFYDAAEYCSSCSCPEDEKSEPNDEAYCSSCSHCGDNAVNCGEECENGTAGKGLVCRNGILYGRIDSCLNCRWNDDGINSDSVVDSCRCKCPKNPEISCIDGNYINYTQDYNAGCFDDKCNSCNCIDTYTRDNNNNGVDDKCDPELCGDRTDNNDNGLIDEESCIWYYCQQCGYGVFNFCTREECAKFKQGCFFNKFTFNIFGASNHSIGRCGICSGINACEDYGLDNITCISDSCSIRNCVWSGNQCCTDKDNDNACDSADNCFGVLNSNQENSDKDNKGDACELCINEPLLFEPTEQKELSCGDKIDNDCDGLADCKDPDCAGIADCCQTANDCMQSNCTIERCADNRCDSKNRHLCDNRECPKGNYCDIDGKCKEPDFSSNVCLYCVDNCIK